MFTARYELSPYIKQRLLFYKGLELTKYSAVGSILKADLTTPIKSGDY